MDQFCDWRRDQFQCARRFECHDGRHHRDVEFSNGDFVQNIVGNYLFRLSNPGPFRAAHQPVCGHEFSLPANVHRNVVSNSTSTTLPNAVVLLFPPRVRETTAVRQSIGRRGGEQCGQLHRPGAPGIYMPVAFENNYAANMATAPVLTLAASQTLTNNLTLTSATAPASPAVWLMQTIPALDCRRMIPAMSSDGLLAITFTDTNGNFNVPVTAGNWASSPWTRR